KSSLPQRQQHPGAGSDTNNSGGAPNPPSKRSKFLQKDEQREECDPKYVHHPADEQKYHQNPAAADTIASVLKPQQQAALQIGAKAAVTHQELEGRLALGETDV